MDTFKIPFLFSLILYLDWKNEIFINTAATGTISNLGFILLPAFLFVILSSVVSYILLSWENLGCSTNYSVPDKILGFAHFPVYNKKKSLKKHNNVNILNITEFPSGSTGKVSLQCRRHGFNPGLGISHGRKWQLTPGHGITQNRTWVKQPSMHICINK